MKKTYFKPEMVVVDINTFQPLLAGSLPKSDTEIENNSEILAPEIDMGLPSYFFE